VTPIKPNVLFIAVDDLRPFLGCYGDVNAYTPNIDRMATRGVTFTNAMCTAPACGPSRASLMTGQLPTRTGIYGFQDWAGRADYAHLVTLPEYLRQHGYRTFASGKIHHNSVRIHGYTQTAVDANLASAAPEVEVVVPRADREWDVNHVAAIRAARYSHDPVVADCIDWSGGDAEGSRKFVSGPSDDDVMDCQDGVTTQFAIDVLQQDHAQPFFLATGFVRPHLPFIAPRQYFRHYPLDSLQLHPVKDDDLADAPWPARRMARVQDDINVRAQENGRARVVQAYYACVSLLDDMVGRILDALAASAHADNTIIVFWSDHGWHLGEKRSWRKFSLWEESARTPMIIADPRQAATAGRHCARPVGLLDLYPTIAELCGLHTPPDIDGQDIGALLANPALDGPDWTQPELTVHGRGNYSLRDEAWRYTRYFDGSEELFNHREDPYEWVNLANHPEYDDIKTRFAPLLPDDSQSAPTLEPRLLQTCSDLDLSDMETFIADGWPEFLKHAEPPLI